METYTEIIKQAPAIAAIVIIVAAFLGFLTKLLKSHSERTTEFLETVKDLNKNHNESVQRAMAEMSSAIRENTRATQEMTQAVRSRQQRI